MARETKMHYYDNEHYSKMQILKNKAKDIIDQ